MAVLLASHGFLGTKALFQSDATLVLILCSALMLTVGWQLAVHKHYSAHRWVQTSAVILNAIAVLGTMLASFVIYILPGVPAKLLEGTYGITALHAILGSVAFVLGVIVVLRGHGLVPNVLRFSNFKRVMRISYLLHMLVTLGGVFVYLLTFG
jgi:uncharacterized membrane protein YozB (DUF420 family)